MSELSVFKRIFAMREWLDDTNRAALYEMAYTVLAEELVALETGEAANASRDFGRGVGHAVRCLTAALDEAYETWLDEPSFEGQPG